MEERLLVVDPLMEDQKLLVTLKDKQTEGQIKELMKGILPYHSANQELKLAFEDAYHLWLEGDDDAFSAIDEKLASPFVNDAVADDVIWNIRLLVAPNHDWEAEDEKDSEPEARA